MPPEAFARRYRVRKAISAIMTALCAVAVVLALVPLAFVLFFVFRQGLPALNVAFFTQMPRPVGETGGGMANAIVGTGILIGLAALIAVPTGITCGVYITEFRTSRLAPAVRFAADILNGVPSIVIGVFAYAIAVLPFRRFSALAGGVAQVTSPATAMVVMAVASIGVLLALAPGLTGPPEPEPGVERAASLPCAIQK